MVDIGCTLVEATVIGTLVATGNTGTALGGKPTLVTGKCVLVEVNGALVMVNGRLVGVDGILVGMNGVLETVGMLVEVNVTGRVVVIAGAVGTLVVVSIGNSLAPVLLGAIDTTGVSSSSLDLSNKVKL